MEYKKLLLLVVFATLAYIWFINFTAFDIVGTKRPLSYTPDETWKNMLGPATYYSKRNENLHNNPQPAQNLDLFHNLVATTSAGTQTKDEELRQRLPNSLIIGFAKCGTHALKSFLTLHPDIVCARKEIAFFTQNYHLGLDWYRQQMPFSLSSQITMEKTPTYILNFQALQRIHVFNASIKLFIMVRDPLIRLQSSYAHAMSKSTNMSFEEFVQRDRQLINHVDFHKYIKHVFDLFGRSQVLVINEDQFEEDPLSVMKEAEHFLSLRPAFTDDLLVFRPDKGFYCFNETHPSYQKIVEFNLADIKTGCFGRNKGRPHPDINPHLLKYLLQKIKPYNEMLFTLIGKRFDWSDINDIPPAVDVDRTQYLAIEGL